MRTIKVASRAGVIAHSSEVVGVLNGFEQYQSRSTPATTRRQWNGRSMAGSLVLDRKPRIAQITGDFRGHVVGDVTCVSPYSRATPPPVTAASWRAPRAR